MFVIAVSVRVWNEMLVIMACMYCLQIMEKYLQQFKVPSGVRISDEMWKELFSEVVKRYSHLCVDSSP